MRTQFACAGTALLLFFQGAGLLAAGGLFALGAAVMLIGDNFFQPVLIGEVGRLPLLIALISIFGWYEDLRAHRLIPWSNDHVGAAGDLERVDFSPESDLQ